jgi:hypothetical protein
MRRLILIGLAAGALGACATPVQKTPRAMSWGVSANAEEGAKLVLGVPETDDVRVVMMCQPRSGRVDLTIIGRRGDPAAVELQSGKIVGHYAGAGVEDEETDGAFDIQLKLPADDPILGGLADTGKLTIVFPTRRIVLPNAFSTAHDFLRICRP